MVFITGLIFLLGLFIGSFLGVVIDRLPKNKSVIKGRSYCDACKKTLMPQDLIPLLSYLYLKGKCRYCKSNLSLFYPTIELITAIIFSLTFFIITSPLTVFNYKFIIYLIYLLITFSTFISIFFIDLKKGIIPDKLLIFITSLTLVWFTLNPVSLAINHTLSAVASFMFFVAISYMFYMITKKDGMGGGDIKLSFVLGLFLGFPAVVVSLYLSFLLGAFVSVLLLIFKMKKIGGALPFGPFLIVGLFITFFAGRFIFPLLYGFLGL